MVVNESNKEYLYYRVWSFVLNFIIVVIISIIFYFFQLHITQVNSFDEVYYATGKYQIELLNFINLIRKTIINSNSDTFGDSVYNYSNKTYDKLLLKFFH